MKKMCCCGLALALALLAFSAPDGRAQFQPVYPVDQPGYPVGQPVYPVGQPGYQVVAPGYPRIQLGFHGIYIFGVDGHYQKDVGWNVNMSDSAGWAGNFSIWMSPNLILDSELDYLWFKVNDPQFSVDNISLMPVTVGLRLGGTLANTVFLYAGGGLGITGGWTEKSGINCDYSWTYYACAGLELPFSPWVSLRPEFRYVWCNPDLDWTDGQEYAFRLDHMQIRAGLVLNF